MLEVKGVRVVVAEDDPAVRDLIITILDLEGYKTWVARDGLEALEVVDAAKPAFVVLDINMPRLDGFDFLAALKKRPMSKKPRVLVLTARNAAEDVKRCVALGAKDYLAKPFTKEQLLGRMARLARGTMQTTGQTDAASALEEQVSQWGVDKNAGFSRARSKVW